MQQCFLKKKRLFYYPLYTLFYLFLFALFFLLFFFFQAEDCIRDGTVTGVQTCALPILPERVSYQIGGLWADEEERQCMGDEGEGWRQVSAQSRQQVVGHGFAPGLIGHL